MSEHILIVDDEAEIANLVELYLNNEGFTVHKCHTAPQALACIDTQTLDLAILDIMLPGMDGFALCRHIRERHTYPVLMLTAKDSETNKITGLALGADDYITKPFRPLELSGIPVVGCGTLASALAMNKDKAHKLAQAAGIAVPRSCTVTGQDSVKRIRERAQSIGKTTSAGTSLFWAAPRRRTSDF